jgi:hypothetical protein
MSTLAPLGYFAAHIAAGSPEFAGGNVAFGSLYEAAQAMATHAASSMPTAGGTLTINGVSLGSYDFCVKQGDQTVSAFAAADWFTGTPDTRSAFVVVNGNLTVNSGITVIPGVRKLFLVVHCTGNLTLNGTISMSLRGANHSGTGNSGGATSANAIRIATGTFSGIPNPTIPAVGGSGGAARTANGGGALGGTASFGTGGGGSGSFLSGTATSFASGAGAAGTCFSGGPGGGPLAAGTPTASAGAGTASGGAGGVQSGSGNGSGVGNPSTAPQSGTIDTGTGGTVVVICGGAVSGAGSVTANGGGANAPWLAPAPYSGCAGGGSGGGSVTVMGKSVSGPTLSAGGGVAFGGTYSGGQGGGGATNTLIIP